MVTIFPMPSIATAMPPLKIKFCNPFLFPPSAHKPSRRDQPLEEDGAEIAGPDEVQRNGHGTCDAGQTGLLAGQGDRGDQTTER